jgi:hypothetical protein
LYEHVDMNSLIRRAAGRGPEMMPGDSPSPVEQPVGSIGVGGSVLPSDGSLPADGSLFGQRLCPEQV